MMKWLPAQDELLLEMHRRKFSLVHIAARFACHPMVVESRLNELKQKKEETAPKPPPVDPGTAGLPNRAQVEAFKAQADPFSAEFLEVSYGFNFMGEHLSKMGRMLGSTIGREALAAIITETLHREKKLPGETFHEWLARGILSRCVVILLPDQDGNQTIPTGGRS